MSAILNIPLKGLALCVRCIFRPLVAGSLLAFLLYAPAHLRTNLLDRLETGIYLNLVIRALRFTFSIGVASSINRALNSWATNNWQMQPRDDWNWPSEIAVVTGGCSGIGKATAQQLVGKGVRVAVLDVQDIPSDLHSNERITYYHCDLTCANSVHETADRIRQELGRPSILINCAAIAGNHTILKTPLDFLHRIFSTNIIAHWQTVQEFVPDMIAQNKGHIVTVASIASFLTDSANADYSATKVAGLAFHESLTSELKVWYKAPGVLTTIIHPSFVRTPLIEARVLESGQSEKTLEGMLAPSEVAQAITTQILSRRGAQIILPSALTPFSWLRGMPNWVQEFMRDSNGRESAARGGSVIDR